MSGPRLWLCKGCEWSGQSKDLLTAPSPFDSSDIMSACPNCKNYENLVNMCDEPGCRREAGCGFPANSRERMPQFYAPFHAGLRAIVPATRPTGAHPMTTQDFDANMANAEVSEAEELIARFAMTCRRCGSDDVVVNIEASYHYSDLTNGPGSITIGCNGCKENDWYVST